MATPPTVRQRIEYKSPQEWKGRPLVHVSLGGLGPDGTYVRGRANGVIAVGDVATGMIAVGGLAAGGIAVGGVALGGLAVGAVAVGGVGMVAVGPIKVALADLLAKGLP